MLLVVVISLGIYKIKSKTSKVVPVGDFGQTPYEEHIENK